MDERKLERALVIHEAAYALLKWLGTAIDRGFVAVVTAHRYVSEADSAAAWIVEHFENIPPDCRPAAREGEDLRWFANYFASYLRCSFDFHPDPGLQKGRSPWGCYCPFCTSLVEAPRLKTSQVVGADRRRADDRKRATLDRLARVGGDPLPAEDVIALLKDDAIRRDLATVAYAEQLLERCEGRPGDRSALALWRQFAWQGHAPKRGYRLTAGAIRESERRVAEAVRAAIRS